MNIIEISDPILNVESMSKGSDGGYWYNVTGPKGSETISRSALIKRNHMALIAFYEEHLRFREDPK